jgi:hypothetical protein
LQVSKRLYRRVVVVENLEKVENTDQTQSLHREFVGLHELDVSANLLGRARKRTSKPIPLESIMETSARLRTMRMSPLPSAS